MSDEKDEGHRPLTLVQRCRIHAQKMDDEGWYVTANVLWLAAEALEQTQASKG